MTPFNSLIEAIERIIRENGREQIYGSLLQEVLLAIIAGEDAGKDFVGVINPEDSPGVFDGDVFYFAFVPGRYVNFPLDASTNVPIVEKGECAIVYNKRVVGTDEDIWVFSHSKNVTTYDARHASIFKLSCEYASDEAPMFSIDSVSRTLTKREGIFSLYANNGTTGDYASFADKGYYSTSFSEKVDVLHVTFLVVSNDGFVYVKSIEDLFPNDIIIGHFRECIHGAIGKEDFSVIETNIHGKISYNGSVYIDGVRINDLRTGNVQLPYTVIHEDRESESVLVTIFPVSNLLMVVANYSVYTTSYPVTRIFRHKGDSHYTVDFLTKMNESNVAGMWCFIIVTVNDHTGINLVHKSDLHLYEKQDDFIFLGYFFGSYSFLAGAATCALGGGCINMRWAIDTFSGASLIHNNCVVRDIVANGLRDGVTLKRSYVLSYLTNISVYVNLENDFGPGGSPMIAVHYCFTYPDNAEIEGSPILSIVFSKNIKMQLYDYDANVSSRRISGRFLLSPQIKNLDLSKGGSATISLDATHDKKFPVSYITDFIQIKPYNPFYGKDFSYKTIKVGIDWINQKAMIYTGKIFSKTYFRISAYLIIHHYISSEDRWEELFLGVKDLFDTENGIIDMGEFKYVKKAGDMFCCIPYFFMEIMEGRYICNDNQLSVLLNAPDELFELYGYFSSLLWPVTDNAFDNLFNYVCEAFNPSYFPIEKDEKDTLTLKLTGSVNRPSTKTWYYIETITVTISIWIPYSLRRASDQGKDILDRQPDIIKSFSVNDTVSSIEEIFQINDLIPFVGGLKKVGIKTTYYVVEKEHSKDKYLSKHDDIVAIPMVSHDDLEERITVNVAVNVANPNGNELIFSIFYNQKDEIKSSYPLQIAFQYMKLTISEFDPISSARSTLVDEVLAGTKDKDGKIKIFSPNVAYRFTEVISVSSGTYSGGFAIAVENPLITYSIEYVLLNPYENKKSRRYNTLYKPIQASYSQWQPTKK